MKNLFSGISLFFLTFIIIFFCCSYLYKLQLKKTKFKKDITTIVCGDSHTQYAVNDSILKGVINISQSGENYLYTYNVLNLLIQNNSSIKSITLGCSFHSFSDSYDNYIFETEQASTMYAKYFSILDYESKLEIFCKNPFGVFKSFAGVYKNMIAPIGHNYKSYQNYSFCTGFHKSNKSNLNDSLVIKAIKRHYYLENELEQGFSIYQKKYLNTIVDLCEKNNIELVIINTPISSSYFKKIPDKFISNYYSIISDFNNRIEFLDFHSFYLENKCFFDGDHINSLGADIFTLKMDSISNKL